jgi:hypothetical protein
VPETASFIGGMTRVDVREDGHGCDVIWDNTVRSAAVPKLSLPDNLITTIIRHKPLGDKHGTSVADKFFYAAVDPVTGKQLTEQFVGGHHGGGSDPDGWHHRLGGAIYQGTVAGIIRILPVH